MASCKSNNVHGNPCRFPTMKGSDYCFNHDNRPEVKTRRLSARAQGGKMRKTPLTMTGGPSKLKSIKDIRDLSFRVVEHLRDGKIDVNQGNALVLACRTALKAAELSEQSIFDDPHSPMSLIALEVKALKDLADRSSSDKVRVQAIVRLSKLRKQALEYLDH